MDVAFANAPVTATGGHPVALRQRLLAQGVYPGFTKATLEGQGYGHVVLRVDDLAPYGSEPGHPGFGTLQAMIAN